MPDPLRAALDIASALPKDQACALIRGPICAALEERLIDRLLAERDPRGETLRRGRAGREFYNPTRKGGSS